MLAILTDNLGGNIKDRIKDAETNPAWTLGDSSTKIALRQKGDWFSQHAIYHPEGESPTLRGNQNDPAPRIVTPVLTQDRPEKRQQGRRFKELGEPAFTLTGQDVHGVMIANTVDQDGYLRFGHRPRDKNGKPQLIPIGYRRIRRLTPVECERLQGFPDGWTEWGIDENGEQVKTSDTQRYRALGNAVTTNVITFLGNKILEAWN